MAGQLSVFRVYGLEPGKAPAIGIGQPGIDFPLRAAPAARAIAVGPKHQLRDRDCEHAEASLALPQLHFLRMLRRTIAHDLDEAHARAQPHHQPGAPESRSILPLMPPFVFASTVAGRSRSLILRGSCRPVLRRKNDVSVLANNFFLGIPSQTLGTDIPADHLAELILRENRKIGDAFNDETQQVSIARTFRFTNRVRHYQPLLDPRKSSTTYSLRSSKRSFAAVCLARCAH